MLDRVVSLAAQATACTFSVAASKSPSSHPAIENCSKDSVQASGRHFATEPRHGLNNPRCPVARQDMHPPSTKPAVQLLLELAVPPVRGLAKLFVRRLLEQLLNPDSNRPWPRPRDRAGDLVLKLVHVPAMLLVLVASREQFGHERAAVP